MLYMYIDGNFSLTLKNKENKNYNNVEKIYFGTLGLK